ncbi:EF-hand calcium-binding domain-containing protein 5 isoform X1 [Ascaphus truei]|uniref:EF-hand calcium-binding domain-containing protein 5 isoform X1 n=2 Tax=Ascaphus truei TaxID=8439 RepID=UPI003F59AC35
MATESEHASQASILEYPVADSCESAVTIEDKRDILFRSQEVDADWKRTFLEKMQQRGLKLQQKTLEKTQQQRAQEEKVKKTAPPDELTREWFSQDQLTVDTRAYLLDKLMPSIVPGVEALLKEAEKKKVLEDHSIKFDPINFLGEHLMRHNPEFGCSSTAPPYVRGLKEVVADLKDHVFDIELNRLAQLKEEMRETRDQRVEVESIQVQVKQMRKQALALQFQEWTLDSSGRIPLALVQSALRSFLEEMAPLSLEAKPVYDKELETVKSLEQKINGEEFIEFIYPYIRHFSTDLFQEFLQNLAQCADMFHETIQHDIWRQIFSDLFLKCDHGKVGFLDRQRVLAMMETFYDKTISETEEWQPRNPRQWPVIELGEMDPADFWADFQEGVNAVEEKEDGSTTTVLKTTEICLPAEEGRKGVIAPEELADGGAEKETEQIIQQEQVTSELRKSVSLIPVVEQEDAIERDRELLGVKIGEHESASEEHTVQKKKMEMGELIEIDTTAVRGDGQERQLLQEKLTDKDIAPRGQMDEQRVVLDEKIIEKQAIIESVMAAADQMDRGWNPGAEILDLDNGTIQTKIKEISEELESAPQIESLAMHRESQVSESPYRSTEELLQGGTEPLSHSEPVVDTRKGSLSQGETDPLSQGETDPLSQRETDPMSQRERDPLSQGETDPLSQRETDTLSQRETDPLSQRETDPLSQRETDPLSQRETDPLSQRETDPMSQRERDPLSQRERDPLSQGQIETVQQSVKELLSQTETESQPQGEKEPLPHAETELLPVISTEQMLCAGLAPYLSKEPSLSHDQGTGSTLPAMEAGTPPTERGDSRESYFIEGKPWSGDLLTTDLALRYSSYGDRSQEVCSAAASKFTDLRPIIVDINSRGPSRILSAFSGSVLNLPQFVQLMETFLGKGTPLPIVNKLAAFIQTKYVETEQEKMAMLSKVRHDAVIARQKLVLQALFEKWDNNGSGFLELDEVTAVLAKYKEGMESEVVVRGRENLSSSQSQRGVQRLSASEFCRYIMGVLSKLPGPEDEVYESLVDFLSTSVALTQAERLRGASRRKWLQQIQAAAETSGGSLKPVYRAVFEALYKDAESHGNNKKISANIGLLEQSTAGEGWIEVLRYVACTSDDAPYVLNRTLQRDMKGVSFAAVDSGTPMHVPRVQYHGNIQFWNTDRPKEERKGSLIVLPLIDADLRVFGTLSIDTLKEPRERNIFLTHEISFYQGVTNVFSKAYHHVQIQSDILQLVSSALAWIYSRAPNIHIINTYLMEPSADKAQDYVFRNMMRTDNNTGVSDTSSPPATLRRRDNLFRDYLFKCADSSEVITTDAYGEHHIAVPIRDPAGRALGVLDLSTGQCRELPAHEHQDLQKMLQMLQAACYEMLEEEPFRETQKKAVLEAENMSGQRQVGVLFHRLMLQDLRQCVSKLDHKSFAELKSYKEPPAIVHSILKAVLLLFWPDWAESEEVHSWSQCKLKVNSDLIRKISSFDPTAQSVQVQPEILAKHIKGIPRGAVWKHGSIPAEHLYNWAFTCLSLLELTQKLQDTHRAARVTLPAPNVSLTQNIV